MNSLQISFFILYCTKEIRGFASTNSNCTELLDSFAKATSNFTLCSIFNSRPITFCEQCVDSYIQVLQSYHNFSRFTDNKTKCINFYENLDRLEIVHTSYEYSKHLWNRAKCYECFESKNETQSNVKSNKTLQFREYYNTFWGCVNTSDPEHLCVNCIDFYTELDKYYKGISNVNEEIGVCMDILDLMNSTWTYWSSNCCRFRRHNEYIFIGSSVGLFILTILFYIIAKFCATKKIPMIIPQRRFAESLHNLST